MTDHDVDTRTHPAETDSTRPGATHGEQRRMKVFRKPRIDPAPTPDQVTDADVTRLMHGWDWSGIVDEDEDEARSAMIEMVRAMAPGSRTRTVYQHGGPRPVHLEYVWFAPNFRLFRHSHPVGGDCLYYIVAGSILMGSQTLGSGDGFFVSGDMQYRYTAGPLGVELLEFRWGGGIPGAPQTLIGEHSVGALRDLAEAARVRHDEWIGATPPPSEPVYDPAATAILGPGESTRAG